MATIEIWHRADIDRFMPTDFGSPEFKFAYEYDDADTDLERAFRRNNRVDGSFIEVLPEGVRSLSVGDVVNVVGTGAWSVDVCGFAGFSGTLPDRVAA